MCSLNHPQLCTIESHQLPPSSHRFLHALAKFNSSTLSMAPITQRMAGNGDNNANINQNIKSSHCAARPSQRNMVSIKHEVVNLGNPPTSMQSNSTRGNQNLNPNPPQLDTVQVPSKDLTGIWETLKRVTQEQRDLKVERSKKPTKGYSHSQSHYSRWGTILRGHKVTYPLILVIGLTAIGLTHLLGLGPPSLVLLTVGVLNSRGQTTRLLYRKGQLRKFARSWLTIIS